MTAVLCNQAGFGCQGGKDEQVERVFEVLLEKQAVLGHQAEKGYQVEKQDHRVEKQDYQVGLRC